MNENRKFNEEDIFIINRTVVISNLIERLKNNEIDLNPEFQRNENLWDGKKMSRLIESLLLKLPLPIFYFDVSDNNKWIVVDGLQRLSTIKKFVVEGKLKLRDLEFLKELNGKRYKDLTRDQQRIIKETELATYQIEKKTPKEVRYSIFHRLNTGGLTLNAQEIRQALNQEGCAVKFLKDLAESDAFKSIVGVSSKRMLDRELVLRFITFKILENKIFQDNNNKSDKYSDMTSFLDKGIEELNKEGDFKDKKCYQKCDEKCISNNKKYMELKNLFIDTLKFSEEILGKGHRFSRSMILSNPKTKQINRSLFDVITVCFSEIIVDDDKKNRFLERKEEFKEKFFSLMKDQNDFVKSITTGTSDKSAIQKRFNTMRDLIKKIIN